MQRNITVVTSITIVYEGNLHLFVIFWSCFLWFLSNVKAKTLPLAQKGSGVKVLRHIQWPKCWIPWPCVKVKGQAQGQFFRKMGKKPKNGHISEAISPIHFILGTKVQPNKVHSMTQMPMALILGQGQIFQKLGKKTKNWSYLGGYFTHRLHHISGLEMLSRLAEFLLF